MSDSTRPRRRFSVAQALHDILADSSRRGANFLGQICSSVAAAPLLLAQLPVATRADYVSMENTTHPNYLDFETSASNDSKVEADIFNFLGHGIDYPSWIHRGSVIRNAGSKAFCIGNLSLALDGVGPAYTAGSQGATALLALLPTASVLVGAPAKELWILHKLCPLAGFLSTVLSLGGNIIPTDVKEYGSSPVNINVQVTSGIKAGTGGDEDVMVPMSDPDQFAWQVQQRARDTVCTYSPSTIYTAMAIQLALIGVVLGGCYFLSAGTLIVWWCDSGYWMFIWYGIVCAASILENVAGVPFTKTITLRVWRAPKASVDPECPWVIPPPSAGNDDDDDDAQARVLAAPPTVSSISSLPTGNNSTIARKQLPSGYSSPLACQTEADDKHAEAFNDDNDYLQQQQQQHHHHHQPREQALHDPADILTALETGYNTCSGVRIDRSEPWSSVVEPFYVLISVRGVSAPHTLLRIFSKLCSIAAFALGTALFASAALVTIMIAMVTLIMILCASVFGRVTAMYMADEMTRDKPVLHKVVRDGADASRYLEAIFRQPGLACEVMGHVIVQGRCVKKFGSGIRWSHVLGVLARPFNIRTLATNASEGNISEALDDNITK